MTNTNTNDAIQLAPHSINKIVSYKEIAGYPCWGMSFSLTHKREATPFRAGGYYIGLILIQLDRVKSVYGGHEWSVSASDILSNAIESDGHHDCLQAVHIGTRKSLKEAKELAMAAVNGDWMLQGKRSAPKLTAPSFQAENEAYETAFEATFFGE